MSWEEATTLERLARGPVVLKRGPRQIAVFRVDGRAFAVDNRCPHEGYPLSQGTVDGECVLTCNWHNWKFRLSDGGCILGGDDVRAYPTREQDGQVWVDLADPPPEAIQRAVLDGLERAFDKRDYGRICREISRLHFKRLDPLQALEKAVEWSHERLETGFTHAYAASADWLGERARYAADWEKQLICLAEAVDHMAFDALRQPSFPYAAPGEPWHAGRFLDAVEGERREEAEGLARRALADGLGWPELEPTFAQAALDHYNDFGHSLIYVHKLGQLLERAGTDLARFLVPALARHLCYTTREDLLSEFREYAATLALLPQPRSGSGGSRPDAPFPASVREAFAWLGPALKSRGVAEVYDALLEALAWNLVCCDASYESAFERPVQQSVGWLDFTHAITFSNAARNLCTRHPSLWRPALLQMACFLGRNRPYVDLALDPTPWQVADAGSFLGASRDLLLDHGQRDPIFSAHFLKTTLAVEDELSVASPGCRQSLLAGLNRFLHSPLKQKHARRLARQAIDLVGRDFAAG